MGAPLAYHRFRVPAPLLARLDMGLRLGSRPLRLQSRAPRCHKDALTFEGRLLTQRRTGRASRAHVSFAWMHIPVWSEWNFFPSRAKKRPLCIFSNHLMAVTIRPRPCNVGFSGIAFSNKNGTIFSQRETCPHVSSAGSQLCIVWGCGGPAWREQMGTFFDRDGFGSDDDALLNTFW